MTDLAKQTFDTAMSSYCAMQERRVRALHNRGRAIFAEFLIAELIGGSVPDDPGWAWDVTWSHAGRDVRIQVKCSGDHTMRGGMRQSPVNWELRVPNTAWDGDTKASRRISEHQCDVFVLARHTGDEIEHGWSFYVLPAAHAPTGSMTPRKLAALGVREVNPGALGRAIIEAVDRQVG